MTFVRACLTATALLTLPAMLATEVAAQPAAALPVAALHAVDGATAHLDTIQYYGGYGYRRHRRFFRGRRLSNGTGYQGRGTASGGPVGGLPNRN